MEFFNRISYRTQLSFLIIGFVLTLSISSFFYFRWLQEDFIKSALDIESEVISELIAEDMAQLIYLYDPDVMTSITLKLKSIKELQSAVFYDLDKKPILKISNESDSVSSALVDQNKLTMWKEIVFEGVPAGFAELTLYNESMVEERRLINNQYHVFLIILILFSVLIVYIFDRRFIARLSLLSSALQHVAEEQDFSKRLIEDKDDDIGKAQQYFNQLVGLVESQTKNLVYKANHDSLTGLYNRRRLIGKLEELLENRPTDGFHAISYLDLDQFKVVNDTCGHSAGDQLLKSLSSRLLTAVLKQKDINFGRLGGDEFIILIRNRSKEEIQTIIHNIQKEAEEFVFTFLEREFRIGISIGCIVFSNEKTTSGELFSAADSLCYQVKNTNRGESLIRYINDDQLVDYQTKMSWVTRINEALSDDLFRIYLQPIVSTKQAKKPWNHFETLIRLVDGDQVISPFHFIPVAERYGMTKKIDCWVIESVFSMIKSHPSFLSSLELVSINLSVLSIVDRSFNQNVKNLFIKYDIPYEKICFEITETGVMSEVEKAIEFISDFRTLGVVFSLDDFGSGMSSFGYLKNLKVDILKIDGQFVRDVSHDPVMKEMVAAMIRIGHISDKKVVAEHVEDKPTLDIIAELGADYIQGYYYSKPMPIEEFMSKETPTLTRVSNDTVLTSEPRAS